MLIPNEIFLYIVNNLCNIESLKKMVYLNKNLYLLSKKRIKEIIINKYFPQEIQDMFPNIYEIPIIKFKEHFIGWTQYMDGVELCDVNAPIMIGVDNLNRPFITFRLETDVIVPFFGNLGTFVNTLFQRYNNSNKSWVFGTYYKYQIIQSNINTYTKKKIKELIHNGKVNIKGVNYFLI